MGREGPEKTAAECLFQTGKAWRRGNWLQNPYNWCFLADRCRKRNEARGKKQGGEEGEARLVKRGA